MVSLHGLEGLGFRFPSPSPRISERSLFQRALQYKKECIKGSAHDLLVQGSAGGLYTLLLVHTGAYMEIR